MNRFYGRDSEGSTGTLTLSLSRDDAGEGNKYGIGNTWRFVQRVIPSPWRLESESQGDVDIVPALEVADFGHAQALYMHVERMGIAPRDEGDADFKLAG